MGCFRGSTLKTAARRAGTTGPGAAFDPSPACTRYVRGKANATHIACGTRRPRGGGRGRRRRGDSPRPWCHVRPAACHTLCACYGECHAHSVVARDVHAAAEGEAAEARQCVGSPRRADSNVTMKQVGVHSRDSPSSLCRVYEAQRGCGPGSFRQTPSSGQTLLGES